MRRLLVVAALLGFGGCTYFTGDDDDGPGSGSGRMCGGFAGAACDADEYCDFDDPQCGIADGGGTCKLRPTVCPEVYSPVRGSDGMVYPNACEAHGAGADDCGPAP